jgi:hypothetical protein
MKFYRDKEKSAYYLFVIKNNNLTAIYINEYNSTFFKNGLVHNAKNAAFITSHNGCKEFYLNDIYYGYNPDFTKLSWRKFAKLQAFL